jgi:hypothetical protein
VQIPAHPEYPSGHTFTVGAVLEVLKRTLGGKDNVSCAVGKVLVFMLSYSWSVLDAAH